MYLNDGLRELAKLLQQRSDGAARDVLEEDIERVLLNRGAKVLYNVCKKKKIFPSVWLINAAAKHALS